MSGCFHAGVAPRSAEVLPRGGVAIVARATVLTFAPNEIKLGRYGKKSLHGGLCSAPDCAERRADHCAWSPHRLVELTRPELRLHATGGVAVREGDRETTLGATGYYILRAGSIIDGRGEVASIADRFGLHPIAGSTWFTGAARQ